MKRIGIRIRKGGREINSGENGNTSLLQEGLGGWSLWTETMIVRIPVLDFIKMKHFSGTIALIIHSW